MFDQLNRCDKENIISQLLKVQAQITVTPLVRHGKPKVSCIHSCIKPTPVSCHYEGYICRNRDDCGRHCNRGCDEASNCSSCCCNDSYQEDCCMVETSDNCNFILTQIIRVDVPISIDADVDIQEGIVCCGKPCIRSADEEG